MHQIRAQVNKKIPIPRKGTKYVARQKSNLIDSVPVVIAIRDMLNLARTTKEVKKMIHEKKLKINGKEIKDHRESVRLFNKLQADKTYILILTENGRFKLKEDNEKERLCKIINKTMTNNKNMQLNLHDGSNVIFSDKANINDTVYLSEDGKVKKLVVLEKGKSCTVIGGKYIGLNGKIESVEDNTVVVKLKDKKITQLEKRKVIVL